MALYGGLLGKRKGWADRGREIERERFVRYLETWHREL